MDRVAAANVTRWEEWKAPITTVAILTALFSTIFISNQTVRLLTQGGLLLAGGAHIYHDRKRPLLFAELHIPKFDETGLYGTGISNSLQGITDANGQPIGRNFDSRIIAVQIRNQAGRRTWYGTKPTPMASNPNLPAELLPTEGHNSLFRYNGQLTQVKLNGQTTTALRTRQITWNEEPLNLIDETKDAIRLANSYVVANEQDWTLINGWQRLQLGPNNSFEVSPDQTLPPRFQPHISKGHQDDRFNGASLQGTNISGLVALPASSITREEIEIVGKGDRILFICPVPPPPEKFSLGQPGERVLRHGIPEERHYLYYLPPNQKLEDLRFFFERGMLCIMPKEVFDRLDDV